MMIIIMVLVLLQDDHYNHRESSSLNAIVTTDTTVPDYFGLVVEGFMMLPSSTPTTTTSSRRRRRIQKPWQRRPENNFLLLRRHEEYRSLSTADSVGEWVNNSGGHDDDDDVCLNDDNQGYSSGKKKKKKNATEEKIVVENLSPSTPDDERLSSLHLGSSLVVLPSTRRLFLRQQFNNGRFAIASAFAVFTSIMIPKSSVGGARTTPTTTTDSETLVSISKEGHRPSPQAEADTSHPGVDDDVDAGLLNYPGGWTGTNLSLVSLDTLAATSATSAPKTVLNGNQFATPSPTPTSTWMMGRWPDPILRRPADPVDPKWFGSSTLQYAAEILVETAKTNKAVGLAAQQCGINARMIYISSSSSSPSSSSSSTIGDERRQQQPLVLVNPRIIGRSDERDMNVWTEECLVLPPTFRATLLRDDWIDVEYDDVLGYGSRSNEGGKTRSSRKTVIRLEGEQSRCFQHEYDHDRGILITDHVSFDELENDVMRRIERPGHSQRMAMAYSRSIM